MQVSSKIVYGLQFMLQLCNADEGEYMQVKEISQKESISEKYLEHIVAQLKSSGLIEVKRGAKGGYRLAKKPAEINLNKIYSSLEKIEIQTSISGTNPYGDSNSKKTINDFLKEFEETIFNYLKSKTLEDLHLNKLELAKYINFQI